MKSQCRSLFSWFCSNLISRGFDQDKIIYKDYRMQRSVKIREQIQRIFQAAGSIRILS